MEEVVEFHHIHTMMMMVKLTTDRAMMVSTPQQNVNISVLETLHLGIYVSV